MKICPCISTVLSAGFIILAFTRSYGKARNILVNPMIGKGSHFYLAAAIGEQLLQRGYNVTILLSNAFEDQAKSSRYGPMFHWEVFQHPVPVEEVHDRFGNFSKLLTPESRNLELPIQLELREARFNDCSSLMHNEVLLRRLQSANFSAVLFDITWVCGAFVGEFLNLPYFGIYPYPNPCLVTSMHGSTFHPAYVPTMLMDFSNRMNFKERLMNSLAYTLILVVGPSFYAPYNDLTDRVGISDTTDLLKYTKLWLVNSDFVGEFPCALAPNVIPVGGLTTRDAQELPSDIEEFILGSGNDGIIICSFGSFLVMDESSLGFIRMLSDAFGRMPQRIIWNLKTTSPFPVPPNVKILPWLPQNDILGHRKTKVLFFHGGHNSYYESIYHGVPMVVMPIFGDQREVAVRIVHFGVGLKLDKGSVTTDNIHDALREVTTNVTYMETAKRMSAAFRDRPLKPADRAAFWIDHALKHGTESLEIPLNTLNFFQYHLIDVITFIVIVIILSVWVVTKCCILMRRRVGNCFTKSKVD